MATVLVNTIDKLKGGIIHEMSANEPASTPSTYSMLLTKFNIMHAVKSEVYNR